MKISINLLPPEIIEHELKRTRFYKIQALGALVTLVMVFLAILTTVLALLQNRGIKLYQAQLAQAEQKVTGLKSTQASLLLLKNRLAVINQYLGVPSKQSSMYRLIDRLIPAPVVVNAVAISRDGGAVLVVSAPDSFSLDTLLSNLSSGETNEASISQVSVESLNRGRDGLYRVSFKIKPAS